MFVVPPVHVPVPILGLRTGWVEWVPPRLYRGTQWNVHPRPRGPYGTPRVGHRHRWCPTGTGIHGEVGVRQEGGGLVSGRRSVYGVVSDRTYGVEGELTEEEDDWESLVSGVRVDRGDRS